MGAAQSTKGGKKKANMAEVTRSGRGKSSAVRLGYDYPPALGDIDCPDSFGYDVVYRVVPGLTFAMCQSGKMTEDVEARFIAAVEWLANEKKYSGITGDCGFMMFFQELARKHTHIPVF